MPVGRPVTRKVPAALRARLGELFRGRGQHLATNPKNKYIAFEVRTDGRSIFTLYTSGKLVSTVRADDGDGALLEHELCRLLGAAPVAPAREAPVAASVGDAQRLAGLDETGTGELLGLAIVAGAAFPRELAPAVAKVAGHVETKTSRAASGWERLGEALAALRRDGLSITALPIPNRLFDTYSKNGLLDLTYLRVVANLLAASQFEPQGLHLALDDYGAGRLLQGACRGWSGVGAEVALVNKADDRFLAARVASVWARSARARELAGLAGDVDDGPLGSGNPGHPATRAWLRARARVGAPWPSFVKTSFSTVRRLQHQELVTKLRVPALDQLLGEAGAAALSAGRLELEGLSLPAASGGRLSSLTLSPQGACAEDCAAAGFLPLLFGGLVLDDVGDDLPLLDQLLERESGLASAWRVLVGPELDPDDPEARALLTAHRRGVIQLEPTREADPSERAHAHGALRLTRGGERSGFCALLS
ncbi:MAG: hypothetical protein DRQ55_02065 [Planctomycetota bacterium]|nr:MAG: hypothetical protein DRQ55_02065 [Planctomycetota bacterium]